MIYAMIYMFDCINNKVEEKEESLTVYYDNIKTTQYSFIYLEQDISTDDCSEQAELDGKCPQFCMQCKENNRCSICKENYGLLGKDENSQTQKIICKEMTNLTNGEYYNKVINSYTVYYPCKEKLSHCVKYSNGNICTECENKYKIENNVCAEIVKDCDEYNADDSCKRFKTGFELIKEEETSCMNSEDLNVQLNRHYYYEVPGDPNYYVKCSFQISNCEECDGENSCLKCFNNNNDIRYGIIGDDKTKCEDLSTNKYFLDTQDNKYKLCHCQLDQCEACLITNTILNCLQCESNTYVLIYEEKTECKEKTSIENDVNYYANDGGLNYY